MQATCIPTVCKAQNQQHKLPQTQIPFQPSNILAMAVKSWKGLSFEEQMTLLIKILLEGLFKKFDLTEFETENLAQEGGQTDTMATKPQWRTCHTM